MTPALHHIHAIASFPRRLAVAIALALFGSLLLVAFYVLLTPAELLLRAVKRATP